MHEHSSECRFCDGLGELYDNQGVRECRACHGSGLVGDRLNHLQVEQRLREADSAINTLTVLTFLSFILGAVGVVMVVLHFWLT